MESSPQPIIAGLSKTKDQLTIVSTANNLQRTQDGQGLIISSHSYTPSTVCINAAPSVIHPSVTQGVANANSMGTISFVDNFLGAPHIANQPINSTSANDLVLQYTGLQPIGVTQSNSETRSSANFAQGTLRPNVGFVPQTQPHTILISDIDGGRKKDVIM